jgi:hypothetical protein
MSYEYVTIGTWNPELGKYIDIQQVPLVGEWDDLPLPGTLIYLRRQGCIDRICEVRPPMSKGGASYIPIYGDEVNSMHKIDIDEVCGSCPLPPDYYNRTNPD